MAGFSDLPNLLKTYSIGGTIPVLKPLRPYPVLQQWFSSKIRDRWPSASRLTSYVRNSKKCSVQIIHAKNDFDIPWPHSDALFAAAAEGTRENGVAPAELEKGKRVTEDADGSFINAWVSGDGEKRVRQEVLRYGGHNRIVTYAPVALAARRAFGL